MKRIFSPTSPPDPSSSLPERISELAQKIYDHGDNGWQLVDVEAISDAGTTTKVIFFFKRLK